MQSNNMADKHDDAGMIGSSSDYHQSVTFPTTQTVPLIKAVNPSTLLYISTPNQIDAKNEGQLDVTSMTNVAPKASMLRILTFFILWFLLSVAYNIFNKDSMNMIKLPWLIATFQMAFGIPLFSTLWAFKLRKIPSVSFADFKKLLPLCFFHCNTHIFSVLALSAGSVSFAHIIKACEPIFTSILAFVLLHELYNWKVYVALTPVVSGVALASLAEPHFSLFAFATAMGANLFSGLRSVYSKKKMSHPVGKNVDPRNLYSILTAVSFCLLLPVALCMEGPIMVETWEASREKHSVGAMMLNIMLSGLCYYCYNEVAFSTLEMVTPVTHAVGSTFKRVFIIAGAILKYGNYPSLNGYVGITVAIAGVGIYSWAKQKFKLPSPPNTPTKVDGSEEEA